jgi:hypothetical protein
MATIVGIEVHDQAHDCGKWLSKEHLDRYLDELRGEGDANPDLRDASAVLDCENPKIAIQYLKIVGIAGLTAPEYIDEYIDANTADRLGITQDQKEAIQGFWDSGWKLIADEMTNIPACEWRQLRHQLKTSRTLFYRNGTDIGAALLLAALPEAYASKWGVQVLAATHQLASNPGRRVRATAQWILSVVGPDGDIDKAWEPGGLAFQAVAGLRLFHQAVRIALSSDQPITKDNKLGHKGDIPINQEDLLGTKLTFCVGVFEVLERFGMSWTADEQLAYLRTWNFIGRMLGIRDVWPENPAEGKRDEEQLAYWQAVSFMRRMLGMRDVWPEQPTEGQLQRLVPEGQHQEPVGDRPPRLPLSPSTVAEARDLLTEIRNRQWKKADPWTPPPCNPKLKDRSPEEANDRLAAKANDQTLVEALQELAPGRVLVDALLSELRDAMPPSTQGWPRTVMQQLCPPVVTERLGLGKAGLPVELVGILPKIRTRVARFTHQSRPNPVSGATLRFMANEVSRRATASFLKTSQPPPFVIPGFEEWSSGIRPR